MKKFRIYARSEVLVSLEVEAESAAAALDKAPENWGAIVGGDLKDFVEPITKGAKIEPGDEWEPCEVDEIEAVAP